VDLRDPRCRCDAATDQLLLGDERVDLFLYEPTRSLGERAGEVTKPIREPRG
jgi:hypothetical protein